MSATLEAEGTDLVEQAIDQVLEQTVMRMTPALLLSWIYEVARAILPPATIARKYGFADQDVMYRIIAENEPLRRRIKLERAVWNSDENLQARIRLQYQLLVTESAHETGKVLLDPATSPAARNDLLKTCATIAGVHSTQAPRVGEGGEPGQRFSITMVFPNAGRVEEIKLASAPPPAPGPEPLVIEGEMAPAAL